MLISTMSITKGAFATVLKNSNFRISSVLLSNTLKNSTNKLISSKRNSNNILAHLKNQYQYQAFIDAKDATRQQSILRLSSLMNYHNSFRNSFSSLQSPKKNSTFNTNFLYSKKNSQSRNNLTSISKDSSSKVTSVETDTVEGRSMTEKFKILTKKYGVSAIVVYLVISALDLGLTFILIQIGGADRVRKVEDWFTETFGSWIVLRKDPNTNTPETDNTENDTAVNGNKSNKTPSWASTLVIAYGIHKLLVPFRLGVTAAVTPPIVKKLKRMGWNIGGKHV
ncbi:unnamed protein product [Rhizophagus irregularis]|uniref:DUF1279 domain-containing protein n=2 Tax=Rhizophagus irregularis TaxID=588596 RepID=A0A915ZK82_9GLOM|nr:unnamed protein product [Rhizophagus irregularis]CAB5379674.1 unnamed protein product [Rhizophagus irregularis]